jgi:hypothetical protein
LDSRIPDLTDLQITLEMARLVRQLGDGHALVAPPQADLAHFPALPLVVYLFDEGAFVTAAGPRHRDLLGARVEQVGEHDTAAVLQALDGIISRDNDQQFRFIAPFWLRLSAVLHALGLTEDPGEITLTLTQTDGSARQVAVAAEPFRLDQPMPPYPEGWTELPDTLDVPRPLYLRHRGLPDWFEHLPAEDLTYFQ